MEVQRGDAVEEWQSRRCSQLASYVYRSEIYDDSSKRVPDRTWDEQI